MKRYIAVPLVLLLLLLSGCAKGGAEKTYSLPETDCLVTFTENETRVSGVIRYVSPQEMKLTLTEPQQANGCELSLNNGTYSLSFDGVSCTLENFENLFDSAKGFQTLFEVFSAVGSENEKITKPKQKITYPLGEAVITFSESGELCSLRAGVYDFEFTQTKAGT